MNDLDERSDSFKEENNFVQFNSSDLSSHPSLDLDRELSYYALDVDNLDKLQKECCIMNSQKVTSLRVMHCANLSSLKGIGNFRALVHLNLSSNGLMSVRGLEVLRELESLDLSTNKITQLFGFQNLTKLRTLILAHNKIDNLEHFRELKTLKQLQKVDLNDNYLTDLQQLRHLESLPAL